jgi:hypothetical protein
MILDGLGYAVGDHPGITRASQVHVQNLSVSWNRLPSVLEWILGIVRRSVKSRQIVFLLGQHLRNCILPLKTKRGNQSECFHLSFLTGVNDFRFAPSHSVKAQFLGLGDCLLDTPVRIDRPGPDEFDSREWLGVRFEASVNSVSNRNNKPGTQRNKTEQHWRNGMPTIS